MYLEKYLSNIGSSHEKQLDPISMTENSGYDCPNSKLYDLCANPNHSTTNAPTPELENNVTTVPDTRPRTLAGIVADIKPLAGVVTSDQAEIKSGSTASDNTIPTKKNLGYNCSLDHSASAIATTSGGPTQESEKYITKVPNQIRHMDRTLERERDVATSEIKSGSAASDYTIPTKKNLGYNCSLDHSASSITTTSGGPTPEREKFATTVPNLIQTERMFDSEEYSTSDAIPTKANSGYNCSLDHSASAITTTSGGPTPEREKFATTVPNLIQTERMYDSEEYSTSDSIPTKANSGYNCSLDHCASAIATTSGGPTQESEKYITTVPNQIRHVHRTLERERDVATSEIKSGSAASIPTKKNLGYNCSLDHSASAIATTSGGPTPEREKFATTVPNLIQTERMFDSEEYSTSDAIPTKANSGYNCSLDHSAGAITTTSGGPTQESEKYITTVPNQIRHVQRSEGDVATSEFKSCSAASDCTIPTKKNLGYNYSLDHSVSAIATISGGPTQECEKYITTVPNQIRPRTVAIKTDIRQLAVERGAIVTESMFDSEEYATSDAIPIKANSGYNCSLDHSASALAITKGGPTQECEKFTTTVPNLIQPTSCSDTASEPMKLPHAYSCSQATLSTNTTTSGPAQEHKEHSTSNAILQSPPGQSSQPGDFLFKETPL